MIKSINKRKEIAQFVYDMYGFVDEYEKEKLQGEVGIAFEAYEKAVKDACEWIKSHDGFTLGFDGATVRDFLNFINK